MIKKIIIAIMLVFALTAQGWAGTLKLKWLPSPETDLGGYKLYYTEEGQSEQAVDVGNVVTYELAGLTVGKFYLIEATAYDVSGNESERSYGVRAKANWSLVVGLEVIEERVRGN